MEGLFRRVNESVLNVVTSKRLFAYILALAIAQGLLYAILFQPLLFDELRHIQFIQFYAHHLNPLMLTQTHEQDYLGQVSREPSYLYYYLMSFVLRFVELFTHSFFAQVLALRIVSIAIFTSSLFILRRLLTTLGFSTGIVNLTLLGFVLVPATAPLIGVVSYDVGVLPLSLLIIYLTAKILQAKTVNLKNIAIVYALICIASVVKFTSLPISFVCAVAIVVHTVRLYRPNYSALLKAVHKDARQYSQRVIVCSLIALIIVTFLFIERPVQNLLTYRNLSPTCLDTVKGPDAEQRCEKNYVYKRNAEYLREKPSSFQPESLIEFTLSRWIPGMANSSVQQYLVKPPSNLLQYAAYTTLLGGTGIILFAYRDLARRYALLLLIVAIIAVQSYSVLYSNYKGYVYLGKSVAISARYLLPVMPLYIALILASLNELMPFLKKYAFVGALGFVVIASQGAGLATHISSVESYDYWPNRISTSLGHELGGVFRGVILGL